MRPVAGFTVQEHLKCTYWGFQETHIGYDMVTCDRSTNNRLFKPMCSVHSYQAMTKTKEKMRIHFHLVRIDLKVYF